MQWEGERERSVVVIKDVILCRCMAEGVVDVPGGEADCRCGGGLMGPSKWQMSEQACGGGAIGKDQQ